ncbi:glycoside hydrolase family 3 C-terminal domain-containing protein [Novosphingobium sp. 1949]|uniref:Glycoside hydrolase family 3 C-terminal domain-containing protein n=1 Tax=Novosphingobium organovorum TaxID=2930092 RepID=A0ABT0BID8_9SPHN|nr:glycoside hydrolase family 3 C-terminal domain-containing protein [Novosphingobium organovorum]MCJ2184789.1 glycoside hydrolase family 3 C-terminal domain-containing protein [Novosphingobium organovorum]
MRTTLLATCARILPAAGALACAIAAPAALAQTRATPPTTSDAAIAPISEATIAAARARAAKTVKAMQEDEKTTLTHGAMAMPMGPGMSVPEGAVPGAGYVPGIARLGVPALTESDASLGVAWVMGMRKDGATAMPSGLAMASSWNPQLLYEGGAMIGSEARAKGFNVLLAGGANLMRDPRGGRTFEYLAEDPLLTGDLVGAAIAGVQSNHIISTIKHFALNGQETGRKFADSRIGDAAARESDLLAFQIGIEKGHPLSVMCAYNKVEGAKACGNTYLLDTVLKRDWGYPGFVMSDWGAVDALDYAINGLDQQSGDQLDAKVFFGAPLAEAAKSDPRYKARLDDMNARVLTAIYAAGIDQHPATPGGAIDFDAHAKVAEETARQGIVLLRNAGNALPLARRAQRIALIGGYASKGVLSGGGSSQVQGESGPAVSIPLGLEGPFADFFAKAYHASSPLKAMRALAPQATITWAPGDDIGAAVAAAGRADVVVVFATKWSSEGFDQADLSLPDGQDAMIAAVAKANPKTIVVLETGNPVTMPWLESTAAVLEAWYPGARGGEAIASVLFGETNPSGHLPITFPRSVDQLPRPVLDGYASLEPDFAGAPPTPDAKLPVDYAIEGSDVGYRWFARKNESALFPFGYGLSYTTFAASGLSSDGTSARFTLTNTGSRAGADVGQVYLVSRAGKPIRRLVGYARLDLAPGASQTATVPIDPRLLADWNGSGWTMPAGDYVFALGSDAEHIGESVSVRLKTKTWKD